MASVRSELWLSVLEASPAAQWSRVVVGMDDHPVADAPDNVIWTSVTSAPFGRAIFAPVSAFPPWYSAMYSVVPSLNSYVWRATSEASACSTHSSPKGEKLMPKKSKRSPTAKERWGTAFTLMFHPSRWRIMKRLFWGHYVVWRESYRIGEVSPRLPSCSSSLTSNQSTIQSPSVSQFVGSVPSATWSSL